MTGNKVLVVDDQKWIRAMLLEALSLSGFIPFEASNINDALKVAYKERPDIALIDLNMPEGDGFSLLTSLKENIPNVEVILMSGSSDMEDMKKACKIGAKGFFEKPFDIFGLVAFLSGISTTIDVVARGENKWQAKRGRNQEL